MATITGQRSTANISADQRAIDMAGEVLRLEPDKAPLTKILQQLQGGSRKRGTKNVQFKWQEKSREARFDAVNNGGGYADSATSIVVDNGDYFAAGFLVKVPRTGEVLRVTSVSTNTLTVTRATGTIAAAALVDNDPLYILGVVAAEGDTSVAARTENPTTVYNYTQIFKETVEVTGSEGSEDSWGPEHDWTLQHKEQALKLEVNKELSFLFGSRGSVANITGVDSVANRTERYTGGILEFATQNNTAAGGTLTELELETWLETLFRYGSSSRTVFCSARVLSVINQYSQNNLQTSVGDSTYGVKVMHYVSAHGELNLVKHHLLEGTTYGGYAIALDLGANLAYRYLDGGPLGSRDTKLLTNRQENDRDGQKDEWITEAGLQFAQPKRHGVLTGVTG